MTHYFRLGIISFLLCLSTTLFSQEKTRILFIFDASNSMNGYWEKERKIVTATRLLSESLESLEGVKNLELGLRVYGHQTKHVPGHQDCEDTELVVDIGPGRNLIIKKELSRITPKGTTPIARSLELGAKDFDDEANCRNIIILITDGIEACDGDPCAISKAMKARGVVLKPFIIGIGIDELYRSTFECVGNYYDASKEETFKNVLDIVISQALNSTTAQINLLNESNQPLETNVPMSIYNSDNGQLVYNFVHTLNHAGNPDTIRLDPLLKYRIKVHTYPPVEKDGFEIVPGEHNILDLNTPQGDLNLTFGSARNEYPDLKCIVRPHGSCEVVNTQNYGTMERYITGDYDLEIQTVPPTIIEKANIRQSHTTDIQIPLPGILLLQTGTKGFGGIFKMENNEMVMIEKFSYGDNGGRYIMQPGDYRVVFRSKNSKETIYTHEKDFSITSGRNTSVTL